MRVQGAAGRTLTWPNAPLVRCDVAPWSLFGISLAGWNDALATNLTSAFLAAKYQLPLMLDRGGGSLIFTSTFVGHTAGMPGVASYAAGKSGLIGLTQALAVQQQRFLATPEELQVYLPERNKLPARDDVPGTEEDPVRAVFAQQLQQAWAPDAALAPHATEVLTALQAALQQAISGTPVPDAWSLQNPVLYTLIWTAVILAVFVPLAVRLYQRTATR